MAFTLVQTPTGGQFANSAAARTVDYTSPTTTGSFLVVAAVVYQTSNPTATISDDAGNTWTQAALHSDTTTFDARLYVWYCVNATGTASHTVTVTPSASAFSSMAVRDFNGEAAASIQDGTAATGGPTSSTTPATGSLTISQADDLVVAVMTQGGANTAITPGGAYTQAYEAEGATNMPISVIYDLDVDANQAADWTLGASRAWMATAAAFKAAAAGGTSILRQILNYHGG